MWKKLFQILMAILLKQHNHHQHYSECVLASGTSSKLKVTQNTKQAKHYSTPIY